MASISDVRSALTAAALAACDAAGLSDRVATVDGWPDPTDLSRWNTSPPIEGGNGWAVISVVDFGTPRSTTRFTPKTQVASVPDPTLAWTVAGNAATLSGTVETPQNLCLLAGGVDYVRAVASGDTLTSIAAAYAAEIPGATASGATVTAPDLKAARVGVVATTLTEVGRQMATIRIGVWAGSNDLRIDVVNAVKPALDSLTRTTLADGSSALVKTGTEVSIWGPAKLGIAQSMLVYQIEYPSVVVGSAAQMIAWIVNVTANGTPVRTYQG